MTEPVSRPYFDAFVRNRVYIGMIALYALVISSISYSFGTTFLQFMGVFWKISITFMTLLFMLPLGHMVRAWRDTADKKNIFLRLIETLSLTEQRSINYFKSPKRAETIVLLGSLFIFFLTFILCKSLIPFLHPYAADPLLAQLDYVLHAGHYPHTLLPHLDNSILVIGSAELVYMTWFFVLPCANGYALFFDTQHRRKMTYLWTLFIMWVGFGNGLAILFSSVGPIFYGDHYSGINPYEDLVILMKQAEEMGSVIWPGTVELLKGFNRAHLPCNLNAISAFPSMHVGASILSTLYAFSVSRRIGYMMTVFTLLIIASSIILGMHYAVDGYSMVIAVPLTWWIISKILKRRLAS